MILQNILNFLKKIYPRKTTNIPSYPSPARNRGHQIAKYFKELLSLYHEAMASPKNVVLGKVKHFSVENVKQVVVKYLCKKVQDIFAALNRFNGHRDKLKVVSFSTQAKQRNVKIDE